MATRLNLKLRDIEIGAVDSDDSYLSAENALINWGRLMRSIADPSPSATAKGSSLFREMKQEYAGEDDDTDKDLLMTSQLIAEGELTERLIVEFCSRRDVDIFKAEYFLRKSRDEAMLYMRKKKHKYATKDNYRRFLDAALSGFSSRIDDHWNIPSETVIPRQNQSAERIQSGRAHQIRVLGKFR